MRFDKKEYFSIRKTKLGVGSVLLGFAMIGSMMLTNTTVSANEVVETEPKVELVSEPVVEETTQPLDASQPEMTTVVEQPAEVVPEIELPVVETEEVEKEIPRIPTREEAFPEEGNDIPTDRTFRAAGDVINKSEFTISVERNDTGKATTDFSDLNGNTINLALKTSIQGINNVVNDAKLVIDIPDFTSDNSKIIKAAYVSAVDSRQTVDKVRVTDEGDTPFTRFTVNLGNQVSGANISIPVILESRTRFADMMTENIKFKLTDSDGTIIVEGNKDVSWTRDPLPKTSIELLSNELTEATRAGAVDVSKTNPVAYVGKWSTNENKPRELQEIYYDLTRNLYTTYDTMNSKGLWNDDFYLKVTVPDDFRVKSSGFSSIDESTISSQNGSFVGRNDKNVYIPLKDKAHYLSNPSISWSNGSTSHSGDLWLRYEGTDKRQSADFKVEVINKRTGEVLNDLTTTYSHKLHWIDFEYVRPADATKGEIYSSYSTGSTFEIDNNDTSITDSYLKAKRVESRFNYSTSTSVDGQPNSTSIPDAYNTKDDFTVVSDSDNFDHELITLKGKTYLGNRYVYNGRNNSDYGYKTQPLVNKIEILPPTISTGSLGDFTWSVDRIITPSVFSEHSEKPTTRVDGQITGWRHDDVDHDYSNIRVYRENIKSGQKSEIGRLGDLLDQTLTDTNRKGIVDIVTSPYSSVKKSNFSYNFKTDITNDLTQDEKIVLEFNNSEIIGLQVDTSYKLSKEAYKSILKNDVKTELSKHLINASRYDDTPFLSRTSKFDIGTREIESTPTGLQIGATEKSAKLDSSIYVESSSTGSTSSTFINSVMKIRANYHYLSQYTSLQDGSSLAEDMKYFIDLPMGIEPSNFEYISKDSDGSQVTRSTTANYIKTVNGQKVYEVVIPKEHHLRFSSNTKTAIANLVVKFDANYNSSIIPSTNQGEAIKWEMGSHITLDPSSSVKYSLSESYDKFDLNNDGETSSPSRELKLYPTGAWLNNRGGMRSVTLLPPKSVFIYNKNSDDNGTNFEFETNGILAGRENPFKTIVFNNSEVEYTNMTVISTLPKAGDDKFDGSEDRGSNITPTLKEAVTAPQGWTVEYTMTEHADDTHAKNLTGWVPASSFTNFANVKAIRYKSSPGTILRKGDVVEFPFTLNVPANARPKDKMVSTSAIAVNGSTEFLEGYRTISTVYTPTGSVEVKYEDEAGVEIKPKVIDMPSTTEVDTEYNTDVDRKPANIEFNGKNYNFLKLKQGSEPTTGRVKEGVTTVTYVYKEGPKYRENTRVENGNITIKYVDENNVTLKEDVVKPEVLVNTITEHVYDDRTEVASTVPSNAEYNIDNKQDKPDNIEFGGIAYRFDRVKDAESLTGKYIVGNKEITLIYTKPSQTQRTESGNVVIKYVDREGNELKSDVTKPSVVVNNIVEQPDGKGGSILVSKTPTNARYDIDNTTDKPATLDKSNIRYTFAEVKNSTPLSDLYTVGTKEITLIYDKTPTETREEKGHVKVRYVDTNDREISSSVVKPEEVVNRIVEQPMADGSKTTVSTTPTGATYDVNADKKNEIRFDNKLYRFSRVKDTQPTGNLTVGETVVTYVYDVVTGDVEVKYVDTRGTEIKTKELRYDDVPVGTTFTIDEPFNERIEFNNRIYHYKTSSTSLTGEVIEGLKTVVHVFDFVTGDVTVHYTDMNGKTIKDDVTAYDDQPVRSNYDTSPKREREIEFDGKVYRFVERDGRRGPETGTISEEETHVVYKYDVVKGDVEVKYVDTEGHEIKNKVTTHDDAPIKSDYDVNAQKDNEIEFGGKVYRYTRTDGNPTGKVTEETTTITYVYDVVKGDVEVKYESVDGVEIKSKVLTHDDVPIKSQYDVNAQKDNEIEFDGKVYRFTRVKDTQPTGEVKEGLTTVTYVYDVVRGDVEVKYINTNGEEIKNKITTHDDAPIKSDYDVNTQRDNEIEHNGKVYRYTRTDGNPTGKVTEETTTITYVYELVTGDVEVKYVDLEGNEIKDKIQTHDDAPIKSDYDVTPEKDNEIEFEDKLYRYVRTDGSSTGKVTEETTTVTYVYDVVKGDVVIHYTDMNGTVIKDEFKQYDQEPIRSRYNVLANRLNDIDFNGKVYRYRETDGKPIGKIVEGVTHVTFKYDVVVGDVIVNYTDTSGVAIKESVVGVDDKPIKSPYDVTPLRDNEIEFGGKVYRYTSTTGDVTGKVTESPIEVTYVYDVVTGDVEVKYVDVDGNEIKDKIMTHDNEPIKSDYDVNAQKDNEIEHNGKVYRYTRTDGNPTGKVTEDTTTITYVYDVVKGDVEVKYVDTDGREIKDKILTHDDAPIKSDYDVTSQRDNEIEFDGKVYRYTRTDGNPTGKVTEDTTTITYVYKVVTGDVEVEYVDVDGNTIKDKITTHDDAPIKSDYDVNDRKENEIEYDGKVYRYTRTDGNTTGKITEETTKVTYVYDVVNGDVEVKYVDVDGNELKDSMLIHDDVPIKSDYDVTSHKDQEIETNGTLYRYVRTDGEPTGKIVEGKTTIIYVYDVVTGDVEVEYVDVNGNPIKDKIVPNEDEKVYTPYDVTPHLDNEIEFGGKVYRHTRTDGEPTGKVTEKTTKVTYVYDVVKGDVEVKYVDINGNTLKEDVIAVDDAPIKSDYDVTSLQDQEIKKDDLTYRYVRTDGEVAGKVTEETTVITYVYDVVKGDVEVVYVDLDGNPIKDKITTDEDKPVDSTYDVTPQRDRVIEKDGQLYRLVRTDGNVTGKITEDKTTIVYVYELINGSVNVKHVNVDGNELVDSELVVDNQPVNSDYSVESSRRVSINKDGKKYQFTGKVTGEIDGKVKEGLTTIVFEYGLVDVPTDYPTIEKPEGEIPKESKVPTDYPTVEKPEVNIKVPTDYPTIEKPEGEVPRESKVPTDYPTIEKPEGEIPRESKVPNDYPTIEKPEGNVPVIPGIEVPEVPEKPQTPEVPVTPEKPQTPETPVQVTTTTVVESNGKQLPKTGDAGMSVTTLFAALSSIASGLFVGFRKKKDD